MARPLSGKRIVVTRRHEQATDLVKRLRAEGATPIALPTIDVIPLPAPELESAVDELESVDWLVFTSANAVRFFFDRVDGMGQPDVWPPMAVVGRATASALLGQGHEASAIPDAFSGEALARSLGALSGQRVLLPRAKTGRPEIVAALKAAGASVVDIALYETVMPEVSTEAMTSVRAGVDVLTFTSPSTVQNFFRMVDARLVSEALICCIGPTTADAVQQLGYSADVVPNEFTTACMVDALVDHYRKDDVDKSMDVSESNRPERRI